MDSGGTDEERALQGLDDVLNSDLALRSPAERHSFAAFPSSSPPRTRRPTPDFKKARRKTSVERSNSNIEHTKYSQIRLLKREEQSLDRTAGALNSSPLGEIPERDYPKLPRAQSAHQLNVPQDHGQRRRLWTQVAWQKVLGYLNATSQ